MRTFILACLVTYAVAARATDYQDRARYWCSQNGQPAGASNIASVLSIDGSRPNGPLSYIVAGAQSWTIGSPPSKAILDALDQSTVDAWIQAASENESAPDTGYATYTRREKFFLRCLWKLAKNTWPSMTYPQFLINVRAEWDASTNAPSGP